MYLSSWNEGLLHVLVLVPTVLRECGTYVMITKTRDWGVRTVVVINFNQLASVLTITQVLA